jgi:hypothetical protein
MTTLTTNQMGRVAALPTINHITEYVMYEYNYILNKYDKQPKFTSRSPQDFGASMVSRQARKKEDVPLFIPAIMDGNGRKNENVEYITMIVVDIDSDIRFLGFPNKNRIRPEWENITYFCYTTFNTSQRTPKWRMIIPITENIPAAIWMKGGWDASMKIFGEMFSIKEKEFIDKSCKNPARAYYYPSHPIHTGDPKQLWNYGKILETSEIYKRIEERKPKKIKKYKPLYTPKRGKDSQIAKKIELEKCPAARKQFCKEAGIDTKTIQSNDGSINQVGYGFTCPNCRRSDATFIYIDGVNAHCNHKNTCGWSDSLYNLGVYWGMYR